MPSSNERRKHAVGVSDIPTYLFYRVYCWQLKMWGAEDAPEYTALFAVAMMLAANLMTLLWTGSALAGYSPGQVNWVPTIIASYSIFVVVGYFLFVRAGAYLKIRAMYSELAETEHRKGRLLLLAYLFVSIPLFLFTAR